MKELSEFAAYMRQELPAEYESMPDIDLYMDQVLAFLSRRRVSCREGDNLTSAMINNYIKDGLVPRANGKKYNREHLVYLSLVSRLKQVLPVRDMIALLRADMPASGHADYYEHFRSLLSDAIDRVEQAQSGDTLSAAAMELALSSYVNKIACAYLIDRITAQQAAENPAERPSGKKDRPASK